MVSKGETHVTDYSNTTEKELFDTLDAVVQENPNFVYEQQPSGDPDDEGGTTCLYVHRDDFGNTSPGCVAGQVFHRLGVPLHEMVTMEGNSAHHLIGELFPNLSNGSAAFFFAEVQQKQDEGETWGAALEYAYENNNVPRSRD